MPRTSRCVRPLALVVVFSLLSGIVPADPASASCWRPPVDAPVVDPYRAPTCPWCAGNRGIEFATTPGTPVRAVASGRVTFAGRVVDRDYVVVEHADGRRATYGNLRTVTVATGSTVVAGSIVGTTSTTLHFGLRQGDDYLDPTGELGRLTYPVRLVPVDAVARRPSGVPRVRCGTPEKPATTGANPFWRR